LRAVISIPLVASESAVGVRLLEIWPLEPCLEDATSRSEEESGPGSEDAKQGGDSLLASFPVCFHFFLIPVTPLSTSFYPCLNNSLFNFLTCHFLILKGNNNKTKTVVAGPQTTVPH
jgi:hypothetical protein